MTSPTRVSVLICDDHLVLTDALRLVIEQDPRLEMVAEPTRSPVEAVAVSQREHPDVVLMDVFFDGRKKGIEATARIRKASPSTKVVIMSALDDEAMLAEALEAGACGFLSKTRPAEEILQALVSAAQGEFLIDPATMTLLLAKSADAHTRRRSRDRFEQLTPRELEVLTALANGRRVDEVADDLTISPQTVQTHVRNILGKLGVHSKLEAVTLALRSCAVSVRTR